MAQQNQKVSAKWALEADYDKDKKAIVIKVNEEIAGRNWIVELGNEAYNNPREAYDKIRPVIDGGNMEIVGGMPENKQTKLVVKITKGYEAYEWSLVEV